MEFEIREQPDSPLRLVAFKDPKRPLPGSPITIRNDGGSVIVAFVLRVDVEPYGISHVVFLGQKGLAVGESKVQGMGMPRLIDDTAKPAISIDYVQFADGSSWGDDALGKGKAVKDFLAGRALALSRLKELLAGQDDSDYQRTFDVFSSSSFSEPNLPTPRGPGIMDWGARGYEEIINLLRRMPRRSEEAKDLARKLEIMAAQPDH